MDKYITDVVQVYLSIFYFLIPLSYKSKYLWFFQNMQQ